MKGIKIRRVGMIRGLLETALLGGSCLIVLLSLAQQLPPNALTLGALYISAGCALWYTLRLKIPHGSLRRKLGFEALNTAALGTVTALVLPLLSGIFGLWKYGEFSHFNQLNFIFLASNIPAYIGLRLASYGWSFWDRLRKRKIIWGLVHTQLSVVVVVAALATLAGSFMITIEANQNFPEATLAVTLVHRIVLTILPFLAVATIGLAVTLAGILPPAALASYLFARRMTRRFEALTETASALRQGDYSARVEVNGDDELAQLQSDFNAMAADLAGTLADLGAERDKVAALLEARRQLIASVSHELRTPLAILRGYLEPAVDRGGALSQEDLTIIQRETGQLERLVEDLFTLSQAEVAQLGLQIQATDINAVIQRLVDIYAPLAWGQGRVEIVAQSEQESAAALADESRLEQIITNLLRNAIRHTPPGGIVALVVSEVGEWVQVEVRDTGAGIAPEDIAHIWERFYRGTVDGSSPGSGAGLGLALVKELTEAMGGTAAVESSLGAGSIFTVKLPKV